MTAVEWLQTKIEFRENGKDLLEDLFKQAKEIEKQQQKYSEEDLKKAYSSATENEYRFINEYHFGKRIKFEKWFEQFKNK